MSSVVAIVGRPNVGKSTLFNRLIGDRKAIIEDFSGVTRDRIYDISNWNGKDFTVIDTGGFVQGSDDVFEAAIREQALMAIEESTAIIFMVDVTTGITDLDDSLANILRKSPKKVFLAVNKVDNHSRQLMANEFWSLGFEETHFLSSISGSGSGELLDAVAECLPDEDVEKLDYPKIAIIGQPNVGKSSLTNALLGEERNIVTDIAGTTRDSLHSVYDKFDKKFLLIDTAGIRKKAKVHENIEFYSVLRAIHSIEEADVCMLLIDATKGVEAQDMAIFGLAKKRKKGIVLLINKWDLVEKETNTARDFEKAINKKISPFVDIPKIFISVLDKQRIHKAVDAALSVYENKQQRIKTSVLNDVLLPIFEANPAPAHRGVFIRIKYITQLPMAYPAFALFCNYPDHLKGPYKGYVENQIRAHFNFNGVPLTLFFRPK